MKKWLISFLFIFPLFLLGAENITHIARTQTHKSASKIVLAPPLKTSPNFMQVTYLRQLSSTYAAKELFANQRVEEIPLASIFFEQLFSTLKFSSVKDVIPSKQQHVGGGNINLLLVDKDGVNLQAGGGVAYSTFETPNGIFGNDHLHPNVNMSLGINF